MSTELPGKEDTRAEVKVKTWGGGGGGHERACRSDGSRCPPEVGRTGHHNWVPHGAAGWVGGKVQRTTVGVQIKRVFFRVAGAIVAYQLGRRPLPFHRAWRRPTLRGRAPTSQGPHG